MFLGFGYDDNPNVQADVVAVLRQLAPFYVIDRQKVRIGCDHDGGYIMVEDFYGVDACYSIGISNDVSWDKGMARRDLDVFQYDHTIPALPEDDPRFHWRQLGLAADKDPENRLTTLQAMIEQNGHGSSENLILKIDIEGGEWDVLSSIDMMCLRRFRQIVGEFHHFERMSDRQYASTVKKAITNITCHHKLVHVHANNWAAWSITGAVPIPSHLELTLFRSEGRQLVPSDEVFPTNLDMPNNPARPDYILGTFKY